MPERRKLEEVQRALSVPEEVGAAGGLKFVGLPPCRRYLSTGSTLLDLAVSGLYPGGVGCGRITHIYGDSSTAKSVLVQEILGSCQRAGGTAVFADAECTLDMGRARDLFGLNVGDWDDEGRREERVGLKFADLVEKLPGGSFLYRVPETMEALYDGEIGEALALVEAGKLTAPVVFGVDSLSALPSVGDLDKSLTDGKSWGDRAKTNSAGFRKYVRRMADDDVSVVAVDQTRDKIGVVFGDKTTVSGGRAIEFYASTRILLKHIRRVENANKMVVGVQIKATVKKNKIAPPFREAVFTVLFDYGVDDVRDCLEWLVENSKAVQSKAALGGSWYSWGEERLGAGIEAAIRGIEDRKLEADLRAEVARVWGVLYAPLDRKRRER